MQAIDMLVDDYIHWIKKEIQIASVGEYYEVTTPFLDHFNDYIQLYIKNDNDQVIISDDGYTIRNLEMNGFNFTTNRKKTLEKILSKYGISSNESELLTKATRKNFALKKHLFLQGILRVNDMFTVTRKSQSLLFYDKISEYFDKQEIFYSDNVNFAGQSGLIHNFDFLLQRTKKQPERLCKAINLPSTQNMKNLLFQWSDTKEQRHSDTKLIVFLNDEKRFSPSIEEGFLNYNTYPIRWSERNQAKTLDLLASA
ncbi:MAG: DUF1829 domain-containing protein [Firmicutes bacterium]|jgi:hypothetical protein|nr:DUF1829 domain-containing protein [Bacillota bacterium]